MLRVDRDLTRLYQLLGHRLDAWSGRQHVGPRVPRCPRSPYVTICPNRCLRLTGDGSCPTGSDGMAEAALSQPRPESSHKIQRSDGTKITYGPSQPSCQLVAKRCWL